MKLLQMLSPLRKKKPEDPGFQARSLVEGVGRGGHLNPEKYARYVADDSRFAAEEAAALLKISDPKFVELFVELGVGLGNEVRTASLDTLDATRKAFLESHRKKILEIIALAGGSEGDVRALQTRHITPTILEALIENRES